MKQSLLYRTHYSSSATHTFSRKFYKFLSQLLQKTGFGFISVKQFLSLIFAFCILGTSSVLNLQSFTPSTYALDAIDSDTIEIDGAAILGAAYLPVLSAEDRVKVVDYTVEAGDTIGSLAQKFKISQNTIVVANNITGDVIRPGDVLKILPTSGVLHTVKKSETLGKIAEGYGLPSKTIARYNNIDPEAALAVDTKLIIPGVEPIIPKVSRNVVYAEKSSYTPVKKFAPSSAGGMFMKPTSGTQTQGAHSGHMALDIANKVGTPVYAAESGTVIRADTTGYNGGYGSVIVIDHGNGYQTLYAHLSAQNIKKGDTVARGQQIGNMGNTGRSTGPHLHFEIIKGKQKLNPAGFF